MTVVAVCSAKGSPGVTTVSYLLAATWPSHRPVVLCEADPSGGDLAARFALSSTDGYARAVLGVHRGDRDAPQAATTGLPGALLALTGPPGAAAATAVDQSAAAVATALFDRMRDWVVDCGRLLAAAPGQRAVLALASSILVVTASDTAALAHLPWALEHLAESAPAAPVAVVARGARRARTAEIASVLGCEVAGSVPDDHATAQWVAGAARRPRRAPLAAAVRSIATTVAAEGNRDGEAGAAAQADRVPGSIR